MNYSYWRTERLVLGAVDRRILRRAIVSDQIVSALSNPEFLVVAGFCIIGLLASVVAMLTVPSFGEIAEALQQLL